MATGRITELAIDLQHQGIQAARLEALQDELDAIEQPGILGRMTASARAAAARHWGHVVGELQESREAMAIVSRRLGGKGPMSEEEADKVKSQLGDLLRVVPAGLLAVANSAFPIPGTGLLTPWLLSRLGLMPSRWREAHLLAELHQEEERLRARGHAQAADQLQALAESLEGEADAREDAARSAALLTFWDANRNGVWDEAERAAYRTAVLQLRRLPPRERARRQWFVRIDEHLFGPCRLTELPSLPPQSLVSRRGKTGWVALDDLLGREDPTGAHMPPGEA